MFQKTNKQVAFQVCDDLMFFLNTLDEKVIDKSIIYRWAMEYRLE